MASKKVEEQAAAEAASLAVTGTNGQSRALLLEEEGDLSAAFVKVLREVFTRFSKQAREAKGKGKDGSGKEEEEKVEGGGDGQGADKEEAGVEAGELDKSVVMTDEELDDFARAVNDGNVMSTESKEEIKEFLDVDDKGQLTYTGFCEMYHLQSGSDAEETWKDLRALG